MTEAITLAHISDVHLGPLSGFHPSYWNMKRALGFANWHRSRRFVHDRSVADAIAADALAQEPDHIAVTGDLANIGLPGEYEAAYAWLQALGMPTRVSVVPGNHDIYTSRLHGASCLMRWAPYMSSDAWGASIVAPVPSATPGEVTFPYVRHVGPVALIGVNSAVPTPPFVAAGELGRAQLDALGAVLEACEAAGLVRVVLIHHPPLPGQAPPRRALRDAADLERVLQQRGAELVLHGHNHVESLAWRQWSSGHIPVIGVASGSASRVHRDEPPARYNLLRISRAGGKVEIECVTRGLSPSAGKIVELQRRAIVPSHQGTRERERA